MKGNSIQILVIQSRYSQWNAFQVLVQNLTSPALGKLQKLAIKQGGEMTGPNQSLQLFQKKNMKITFKKSVLWGRRETQLRGEKKKTPLLQGDTKNYKIVEQCFVLFSLVIEDFLASSCQDAQSSQ